MELLSNKLTGDDLTAAEWNQVPNEIENVITSTGQTLSNGDLSQLVKGIAEYCTSGDFYLDSGAANAYVLAPTTGHQAVYRLYDGARFRFIADNANTAASTANVAGLGAKAIVDESNAALTGGEISTTGETVLRYDAGSDNFKIFVAGAITSDDVANNSTVPGSDVTDALNNLAGATGAIQSGYSAGDSVTGSQAITLTNVPSFAANTNYQMDIYVVMSTGPGNDISLTVGYGSASFNGSDSFGVDTGTGKVETKSGPTSVTISHTSAEDTSTGNQVHKLSGTVVNATGSPYNLTLNASQTGTAPGNIGTVSVVVTQLA